MLVPDGASGMGPAAPPYSYAAVYDPISGERHGSEGEPPSVDSGPGRQNEQRRSVVTDRRDEERERKDAERRRDDERRSDELREAWRRNHPSRPEEGGERRPRRGRR